MAARCHLPIRHSRSGFTVTDSTHKRKLQSARGALEISSEPLYGRQEAAHSNCRGFRVRTKAIGRFKSRTTRSRSRAVPRGIAKFHQLVIASDGSEPVRLAPPAHLIRTGRTSCRISAQLLREPRLILLKAREAAIWQYQQTSSLRFRSTRQFRHVGGDLRLFGRTKKKPQVFRKRRGSPALQVRALA